MAVEHFKICTQVDPRHAYAYNNLAFIYNMHQYYQETINVCNTAKMHTPEGENHTCHRHWAFALFKRGEMAKAIKKIKKGILLNPQDADNWIVWGLILRTVGSYPSAQHKFEQALKADPDNETAAFELDILRKIMELDEQISLDQVPAIKLMKAREAGEKITPPNRKNVCGVVCGAVCSIF